MRPSVPPHAVESAVETALVPYRRVLVAVSGGVDSTVLLRACRLVAKDRAARGDGELLLEVAHVDHGVRSGSAADAEFVARLAAEEGLSFHLKTLGGPPPGANMEAWGRRERYRYFLRLLSERALDCVVTAHTRSDLVETFLMKLLANKEPTPIARWEERRRCLRPLLELDRRVVEGYATAVGVRYVTDETNADLGRTRNRIRHLLVPRLEADFGESSVRALGRRALAIAEDVETLRQLADRSAGRAAGEPFGTKEWLRVIRRELSEAPVAVKWRIAERLLLPSMGFNLGREHGLRVARFLEGSSPRVQLPGGSALERRTGGVVLTGFCPKGTET